MTEGIIVWFLNNFPTDYRYIIEGIIGGFALSGAISVLRGLNK